MYLIYWWFCGSYRHTTSQSNIAFWIYTTKRRPLSVYISIYYIHHHHNHHHHVKSYIQISNTYTFFISIWLIYEWKHNGIDSEENKASIPKSLTLIEMCLNESNQFNMHYMPQTDKTSEFGFWIKHWLYQSSSIPLRLVAINCFAWLSTPQKTEGMTQDTLRKQASSKHPSGLLNNLGLGELLATKQKNSCYGVVRMVAHLFSILLVYSAGITITRQNIIKHNITLHCTLRYRAIQYITP